MRYQGKLKKWDADRGYGFIEADDGGQDIFVHVSAFARDGTAPTEGERLSFEIEPDRDGKKKAVRVSRPGVQAAPRTTLPRSASCSELQMRRPPLLHADDLLPGGQVFSGQLPGRKDGRKRRRRALRNAMVQVIGL